MLKAIVTSVVGNCTRFPWPIIVLALVGAASAAVYSARHFAINTDVNKLISRELDWRQREAEFEKAFPGHFGSTLVVIDAPTAEYASRAAAELGTKLKAQPQLFHSVNDIGGSDFFARNGLLYKPTEDVAGFAKGLGQAAPLVGTLVGDPSLRGLTRTLSLGLIGVQNKLTTLDALARPLSMASTTIEGVLAGRPASFSWQAMLNGQDPGPADLRRLIEVRPVLDFSALQPGQASSNAIRQAASDLQLDKKYQARVRLTGSVPIADEEFATVQEGALQNAIGTVIIVLVILWLALKSARLIVAVFINLVVGLALTAAFGLMMVGALNMISVAFAVLFVGLGVDFGIQFSVRYRAERHDVPGLAPALVQAAEKIGVPLTLAAAAVAAGFLSFLPTDYRGVSELGQIAGVGMLIAYVTSITLLPALITVLNPTGEAEPIGYSALAPVDRFLQVHRVPVIVGTLAAAVLGAPLLYYLTFDFDPIHLRSTKTESISTLLALAGDPQAGTSSVNIVTASLDEAASVANKLRTLPQVLEVKTLLSFVPQDQDKKLGLIRDLNRQLGPALQKPGSSKPPTDADNIAALNGMADQLNKIAGNTTGAGADAAKRLAADAVKLAQANEETRARAQNAFIAPLETGIAQLRGFLTAQQISKDNLPGALKQLWVTPDGRARVEVAPKGDTNDTEVLRSFARAVLAVYPNATGGPISILESSRTVVRAFLEAGFYALVSIAILLWIVLRRFGDVLLTLVPLLLAGVVTLEICVLIDMPLNFANIIALPLLLGVGVAFKIYYIMAWRSGRMNLLQSSLTRAVIWSALTTATAFGSLWLSQHPGTSSMGKLLALSLVCTLAAAVLFQPALMGKPRSRAKRS
ncbi:MAG TPA: MMPL family transporter [Pseudolabrys sp.]|jgi:hopanoid biosynthesis associated RND transporter like protein HpnN|nr:MMPL family transporter [Pseudolabrys sp.]